mgnify:CR=1 FL=1
MTNILCKSNQNQISEKLGLDIVLHGQRVAELSVAIGKELGLSSCELINLAKAANLHDIGKVGISESILYKPGRLTPAEQKQIISHPVYSAQILVNIASLRRLAKVVLLHHENYDGSGYFKIKGDNIPLHSRIITVADCYDAMTNDRPYRPAKGMDDTIRIMDRELSYKYDPKVYAAFLRAIKI